MNDEDRDYGVLVLGVLAAVLLLVIGWSTGVIPGNPAFAPTTAATATATEAAAPATEATDTAAATEAAPDTAAADEGAGALDTPTTAASIDIVAATKAALAAEGVTGTTGELGVAIGAVPDSIRLTGEVADDGVKIKASDVAATVTGVASVDNQLTIAGAPDTAATETAAAAAVSAAPATITGTASEDGTVVLTGVVASEDVKTAVGTAVSSALPAGSSVDNQITVDAAQTFDGLTLQLTGKARPDLAEALGKLAMPGLAGSTIDNQVAVVEAPKLEAEMNALFAAEPIQFDSGAATIKAASNSTLDKAAALMKATPTGSVALEGHTDDKGDPAKNQALSQARAEAVQAALVSRGVAADRLSAKGFGSSRPIADNATPDGRAKNRRVEVVVSG